VRYQCAVDIGLPALDLDVCSVTLPPPVPFPGIAVNDASFLLGTSTTSQTSSRQGLLAVVTAFGPEGDVDEADEDGDFDEGANDAGEGLAR
jgi:hypothetical protein